MKHYLSVTGAQLNLITLLMMNTVARMRRLYETGIGLTTGFIGSHTVTHNYSVYTLTAQYSSL
jgi:hypothetical protein